MTSRILPGMLALLWITLISAQENDSFGKLTKLEQQFTTYEKDKAASAIVLYEKADNYFEVINHRIWLVKDYHGKIKILNDQGFGEGTIAIPFYKGDNDTEKVTSVRAVTHNGTVKTGLLQGKIYTNQVNEHWSEKTFTFPNIKTGSILEYQYRVISPFIYNLNGWTFQSNIPKLYSEYNARIPANYKYNRSMSGYLKLAVNEAHVKKSCFRVEGFRDAADCEVLKYAMEDVPAFKEEEFMLASSNYNSRIDFELAEYHHLNGTTDHFTRSWNDVDKEFKSDRDIGRQLTKKGFFEKNVPGELLTEGDPLTRAGNIYEFVQNHYTWNGKYGIYRDIRVKEAFDEKKGNVGEINISLINLLNAADIPTKLMLMSTRNHGLPKRNHPVMSDFNYLIAMATIDGKTYLLDATDKFMPFGLLPYRCLNYYGRVMDFKNDSYWEDIRMNDKSKKVVRAQVTFDEAVHGVQAVFDEVNIGYDAIARRRQLAEQSRESYLEKVENRVSGDMSITSYELLKDRNNEKMTSERFKVELNSSGDDVIYFDPFLVKFFDKNPFFSNDRYVPVDFGYNRNFQYTMNLVIPEGYEPDQLPENREIHLPDNMGLLQFSSKITGNNLNMNYTLMFTRPHFTPDQYPELKSLFRQAVDIENTSLIVFKKKET